MNEQRKADCLLVLMLFVSGILSVVLFPLINDYVQRFPDSFLMWVVQLLGHNRYSPGIDLNKGIVFLPFSILGGISFLIYFKVLKGNISKKY